MNVDFQRWLASNDPLLTEGAVIERLRRNPAIELDPHVLDAGLVETATGRRALSHIYHGYLDAARDHDLTLALLTPTWRASAERCRAAGHDGPRALNTAGALFLRELRAGHSIASSRVLLGGLLGCRGDAYDPTQALSAERATTFHAPQLEALAHAGLDFLHAATLPASSEALGLARAMAETGLPYTLGFVLRGDGSLLDGHPLAEVIARIDDAIDPAPLGYLGNCVHPEVFASALERGRPPLERIIGLQANTSRRSPEELDGAAELDGEEPEPFARAMLALRDRFALRILGGCCGTDDTHLRAIAERLARR